MALRIATWNLDRPKTAEGAKFAALRARMLEIDADLWLLTESHELTAPSEAFFGAHAKHIENYKRHTEGERRASVWSKFPIVNQVETHDAETAVCVEIQAPIGRMLVYSTVIPYHAAGTSLVYRSGGEFLQGLNTYELHLQSIERHRSDWVRLRHAYPEHYFVVAGDFNQHRDGVGHYGKQGVGPLDEALKGVQLTCVTGQDFKELGELKTRRNVDHICLDVELSEKVHVVHAWEAGLIEGKKPLSDHNGVWLDLAAEG